MCGPLQKECVDHIPFKQNHTQCLAPCQGLIVSDISAEFLGQNETESLLGDMLEEYERYKRQFQDVVSFPEELKSNVLKLITIQPTDNIFHSIQNFSQQRPENIQKKYGKSLKKVRIN